MDPWHYFKLGSDVAALKVDCRAHKIGAVGLRADGVMVVASNGPAKVVSSTLAKRELPGAHAEARLCRKMDYYGTVFVSRRTSNGYLLARPCNNCQRVLKSRRVKRVYYTISNTEYGVMEL